MADETEERPERPERLYVGSGSRPVPDPTVLTTEQLNRSVESVREFVRGEVKVLEERLHGIDVATTLRLGGIEGIPGQIKASRDELEALMIEKFQSVDQRFTERDIRSEREARDNKVAVDAAFAAQKEAAAKQDEANQKAIDKSEKATTETINKLNELFKTTTDGLADKIDDLKAALATLDTRLTATAGGIIADRQGGERVQQRQDVDHTNSVAIIAIVASIILALLSIGAGIAIAAGG